jgi:hypothetical protein
LAEGVDVHVKDGDGRVPFQYADERTLSYLIFRIPSDTFLDLIQSDAPTSIRLSFRLLTTKIKSSAIELLLDHADLFVSSLALVAGASAVSNHTHL